MYYLHIQLFCPQKKKNFMIQTPISLMPLTVLNNRILLEPIDKLLLNHLQSSLATAVMFPLLQGGRHTDYISSPCVHHPFAFLNQT